MAKEATIRRPAATRAEPDFIISAPEAAVVVVEPPEEVVVVPPDPEFVPLAVLGVAMEPRHVNEVD